MKDHLNVFVTADPDLPVPPRLYGGIERVIALLVDGLVERGHSVTLFAHAQSQTRARLIPFEGRRSASRVDTVRNAASLARRAATDHPDIIHSFGRLAALLPVLPWRVPKLMSYQREVTRRSIARSRLLAGDSIEFAGCSRSLIDSVSSVGRWHVIYNAVDVNCYPFGRTVDPSAPLVFLGRVEHIKGTHIAIDVARQTQRRLIIAGNVPDEPIHRAYFDKQIQPHVDGQQISYVGPVDNRQKAELLTRASALLMPVLWEEPFGIVMAEALACGTPVIGLSRGAVPEVVDDGVTGFVCGDAAEMATRVTELDRLDRAACRRVAEGRFSQHALVDGYESVYRQMVSRSQALALAPSASSGVADPNSKVQRSSQ